MQRWLQMDELRMNCLESRLHIEHNLINLGSNIFPQTRIRSQTLLCDPKRFEYRREANYIPRTPPGAAKRNQIGGTSQGIGEWVSETVGCDTPFEKVVTSSGADATRAKG